MGVSLTIAAGAFVSIISCKLIMKIIQLQTLQAPFFE
jgi:hypothetical protein